MKMQSDVVIKPDYCTCYTLEPGYQRYRLHFIWTGSSTFYILGIPLLTQSLLFYLFAHIIICTCSCKISVRC